MEFQRDRDWERTGIKLKGIIKVGRNELKRIWIELWNVLDISGMRRNYKFYKIDGNLL